MEEDSALGAPQPSNQGSTELSWSSALDYTTLETNQHRI